MSAEVVSQLLFNIVNEQTIKECLVNYSTHISKEDSLHLTKYVIYIVGKLWNLNFTLS